MTLLITGATGTVSGALLRALPGTDDVRVLVRDPARAPRGVDVAVGDLHRPETLEDAFKGVETVWLLTAMGPDAPHAGSNAVWAAREAGVRHVVRMSAIGAGHDAPTRNGRLHVLSDIELAASGLSWTVIRLGLLHAEPVRVGQQPARCTARRVRAGWASSTCATSPPSPPACSPTRGHTTAGPTRSPARRASRCARPPPGSAPAISPSAPRTRARR
ncbi:NAD(P)H-binding protein [Nonomuraea ferruginea]